MDLNKASVFAEDGIKNSDEVINQAKKNGMTDIRLVELHITEKDPLNK